MRIRIQKEISFEESWQFAKNTKFVGEEFVDDGSILIADNGDRLSVRTGIPGTVPMIFRKTIYTLETWEDVK